MGKKIAVTFYWLLCFGSGAQNVVSDSLFSSAEKKLQDLQEKTFRSRIESERLEGNREFIQVWDRIVEQEDILRYDFKLKDVSILRPPDKSFMLITWNLAKNDGTHAYFGYVLCSRQKEIRKGFFRKEVLHEYQWFKLLDRSAAVNSPESYTGYPEKWFGMLYTTLIPGDEFYTLLGWDGNNKLTQRKFVDILSFRSDGTPVFGKPVFRVPRKNPRRLMFEYSSDVTMSLRFDERNDRIVFSHLAAHKDGPMLEGQYQFYGPDGSFDALIFRKGRWETVEDIDARNAKSRNDNVKKPDPKKQKPVYTPK